MRNPAAPTISGTSRIVAPAAWRTVDLLSDLHLQASDMATFDVWQNYLDTTPADAVFILGDLFEVWIGDDAAALPGFESDCCDILARTARRVPVFFMHGNRDFLVGEAFATRTGIRLLDDPTLLELHGRSWLLSHGDLLCLADTDYLAFRKQVRSSPWRSSFLAKPLEERRAIARSMRTRSEERKRHPDTEWADVDSGAALDWLHRTGATTLIHGHTHRPADHDLASGFTRSVLSDWDAGARPCRAQVLSLTASGPRRVELG